jgi:hypothetical protein
VVTAIKLPVPVAAVCQAIAELETAYGRKFTIDGHLLGSIGEVVARDALGLELYGMSRKGHDGLCKTRGEVQIKITAKNSIALRHSCNHLIVLKMDQYGKEANIVYDGPGAPIWALVAHKKKPSNGQYQVSLTAIEEVKRKATWQAARAVAYAPCLPTSARQPPSGDLWLHEIKHDGFRVIARKNGARVKLCSRRPGYRCRAAILGVACYLPPGLSARGQRDRMKRRRMSNRVISIEGSRGRPSMHFR